MHQCLKCGKKTEDRAVFCNECLAIMEQYPVKPGTVVHIPRRPPRAESKAIDTFDQSVQTELISHQRGMIRWLTAMIAVLSILLVITAVLLIRTLDNQQPLPAIGRNYTTSTTDKTP